MHKHNTRSQAVLKQAAATDTQSANSVLEEKTTEEVHCDEGEATDKAIPGNSSLPQAQSSKQQLHYPGTSTEHPVTSASSGGTNSVSFLATNVVNPGQKIFEIATFQLRLDCWEIRDIKMKTDILSAHLTDDTLIAVQDLVFNKPTYDLLKERLLQRYEPSMSARVAQLLQPGSLGDRKPSEILTFLKTSVKRVISFADA